MSYCAKASTADESVTTTKAGNDTSSDSPRCAVMQARIPTWSVRRGTGADDEESSVILCLHAGPERAGPIARLWRAWCRA